MTDARDFTIRIAAAEHVRRVTTADTVTSEQLAAGFVFEGERVPLVNPRRGIFKPATMEHLLSVRTVFPRTDARVWYDDQRVVHEQVASGRGLVEYALMGDNPEAADNRWLKRAHEAQVPILYFLGVAPARFTAIWPTFVAEWHPTQLKVRLAFGQTVQETIPDAAERRYASRLVQQRLHQATFREAVLTAYGGRCAITRLPEPRLLDAAHIIVDGDEALGQPIVPNGLPLSKIHHAAFDANLIGIDADYRIHVSDALMSINDGPMFEYGVKALAGRQVHLPTRMTDYPSRDRLAQRFEEFRRSS